MGEFNLASVLRDVSAQDLGQTGREQIRYIDIDLIDPDPKNFYELSDLDELAANIELVGLQQPLRVRVHPDDAGRWMIVSGHRRRAAILQLVDEGKEQFRAVACIVEQPAVFEEMQELRLIFANSGTRKLTPAELSEQAVRSEMLFYKLKEKGVEFPGRMRDHVAEACRVSKSKLSRLKVIRDKLIPELQEFFKAGDLSEDAAYFAAQTEVEIQRYMLQAARKGHTMKWQLESVKDTAVRNITGKCEICFGPCDQFDTRMQAYLKDLDYLGCNGKCCADCSDLRTCDFSCGICIDKKEAAIAEAVEQNKIRREKAKAEKELREATEERELALKTQQWKNFGERRAAMGMTPEHFYNEVIDGYFSFDDLEQIQRLERGEVINLYEDSPLDYMDYLGLCVLAEELECTLDYLFGRTVMPQPPTATLESAAEWLPYEMADDMLEDGDEALVLHRMTPGGPLLARIGVFRGHIFREREYEMPITGTVAWQHYHAPDLDVPDSGTDEMEEDKT